MFRNQYSSLTTRTWQTGIVSLCASSLLLGACANSTYRSHSPASHSLPIPALRSAETKSTTARKSLYPSNSSTSITSTQAATLPFPVFQNQTAVEQEAAIAKANPHRQSDHKYDSEKLYKSGLIVGGVGLLGTLVFGTMGVITQHQLNKGYSDGITYDREDTLQKRGHAMNALAGTSATLAILGGATALVTYIVDYNRCGPLYMSKGNKQGRPCGNEAKSVHSPE